MAFDKNNHSKSEQLEFLHIEIFNSKINSPLSSAARIVDHELFGSPQL
jgi:hypothetical protein